MRTTSPQFEKMRLPCRASDGTSTKRRRGAILDPENKRESRCPGKRAKGLTMPQAIMDPEEVRNFARELKRFHDDLQGRMASLQARFGALGETWEDQEHEKFAEEFRQAMKALHRFLDVSSRHAPLLMRKARRIDDYLNQQ